MGNKSSSSSAATGGGQTTAHNTAAPKKVKKEKVKQTVRVLNLGISGSGKTTFAKQMKIITQGGFTDEEKDIHKRIIFHNIKLGLQELIKFAEKIELSLEPQNLKHSRYISKMDTIDDLEWTDKLTSKAKLLWTDSAIQQTWRTAARYQMQIPHLDYYMENIDRITDAEYTPTNDDMLRTRQRTTGEQLTTFVNEKIRWELVDAGGQKPERSKWESIIMSKESVNAIIYFVALDEYNVQSTEDPTKTKMQISLESWHEVLKSEPVKTKHITLILFLNKMDIFTEKLSNAEDREQFEQLFPDYQPTGPENTMDAATDVIKQKFLHVAHHASHHPKKQQEITSHCLCALDTSLMMVIFKAVKNTIFDDRIMTSMIKM